MSRDWIGELKIIYSIQLALTTKSHIMKTIISSKDGGGTYTTVYNNEDKNHKCYVICPCDIGP